MEMSAFPFLEEGLPRTEVRPCKADPRNDSWGVLVGNAAEADFVDVRSRLSGKPWDDGRATSFPGCDDTFLGFRLVAELGRGAFARVYLARQDDLAERLVALKVSTEAQHEAQNLAQLQHTHIVPVYSVHRAGSLHAVCMPYFGSATLADVLRDLQRRQTPPASGKGLVSTIENRFSKTRASLDRDSAQGSSNRSLAALLPSSLVSPGVEPAVAAPRLMDILPTLRMLEGLTYVDAVLWIGQRLAEALAHSHARGILHGDLKPANILLTDDGQPMLLDFNLSTDLKADASRAQVGGTLPYMAPEHLASFAKLPGPFPAGGGAVARADARSDVYSLGVILYELLTGRTLFHQRPGKVQGLLPDMIRDRLAPPPRVRQFNRNVTPAVESILRHCLEPDPARRYQSARELAEDLQRQGSDRPLAHAREGSLRERAAKWLRRNRRGATWAASLAAIGVIVCLVAGLALNGRRLGRMEAAANLSAFHEQRDEAQMFLAARPEDGGQRREGLRVAHEALGRYNVLAEQPWREQPAVLRLPADDRRRLTREVGELLLLTAGADEADRKVALTKQAADCFPADETPRALFVQRAEQAERRGDLAEARVCRALAEQRPPRNAADHYLLARKQADAGQTLAAIESLREAVRLDPKHFAAWYLLGNCHLDASAASPLPEAELEAIRCYTVCMALRPGFYGCRYNRGLARLRQNNHAEAEADFTAALALRPGLAAAHLHRGLVRQSQGKLRPALDDLNRAIDVANPTTRAFFTRASLHDQLGDKQAGRRDREEGLRRTPPDAESYVVRGIVHMATDVSAALADFREAVRINPLSVDGRFNQALILADRMDQPEEAIRLLDQILSRYPHLAKARAIRGILHARGGRREAAHRDGEVACKAAPTSGTILYQAARIHSLTSRTHPQDRTEAFQLLTRALQQGLPEGHLQTDTDLAPLRRDDRFRALTEGVRLFKLSQKQQTD